MKLPVLVTGAGGFLGCHLVGQLLERDHSVVAIHRSPSSQMESLLLTYPGALRVVSVDLRQEIDKGLLSGEEYSAVVHLASFVPSFRKAHPADDLSIALEGVLAPTMHLLEAIRGTTDSLLFASTVTVYGDRASGVIDEQSPCWPVNPYGVFKLAAEGVCRWHAAAETMDLAILRVTQLYGFGEPHGLFLQRVFLPQVSENGRIALVHGGREEKDLLWVEDAADAFVKAIEHRATGVFNISSGKATSIRAIAEMLRELRGGSVDIEIVDDDQPALSQAFDSRRAREAFGFRPTVSLREGLRRLCEQ